MATRTDKSQKSPTNPARAIIPETGFLRLKQLVGDPKVDPPIPPIIPIASSTLWRKIKAGTFPAPVKLGPMTTAFKVEDIRSWIEAQGQGGIS